MVLEAPAVVSAQATAGDRARARDFLSAVLGREVRGGRFVEELAQSWADERLSAADQLAASQAGRVRAELALRASDGRSSQALRH